MNKLIAILMLCATVGLAADSTVMDGDWSSVAGGMFYRPVQWSSVAGGMFYATSAAATSAPPSVTWFVPTNGQSVAGYYVRNYGSAGAGFAPHSSSVVTQRGSAMSFHATSGIGFDESGYTGVSVRFSGTWMNGATQFTVLHLHRSQSDSQSGTALFRGTNTASEYFFSWPDYDFNSYHVITRVGEMCQYKVHRVLSPGTWFALSYHWRGGDSATHTSYVDGVDVAVYAYDTGIGVPTGAMAVVAHDFCLYVNAAWAGDIFATTNTVTWEMMTNWNYQTAEATYNSNWPSLFTGDVEVTWREWSTNQP